MAPKHIYTPDSTHPPRNTMNHSLYRRLCNIALTAALLLAGAAHAAAPYVDNGNGTVTDTVTGLMWDQCTLGRSGSGCSGTANTYTWANAISAATTLNSANYKGHNDWRVPSIVELESLVKLGSPPVIDTVVFPNTPAGYFWSATPSDSLNAWYLVFYAGNIGTYYKQDVYSARLVRGGQWLGTFGLVQTGVSGTAATATTLTATSPVAATGYWVAVARNATAPSASEVAAGTDYGATTVVTHGSGAMTGKAAAGFAVTGLAAGTDYDIYVIAKDSSSYAGYSDVSGPLRFTTQGISLTSIVIDPVTPTTLYVGLDGAGVYKSVNGSAWIRTSLANINVKTLHIDSSGKLYAGTDGNGVFKSSDGGGAWSACANPGNLNLRSLAGSGTSLYAGTLGGVFVSTDACASWSPMNSGLPL